MPTKPRNTTSKKSAKKSEKKQIYVPESSEEAADMQRRIRILMDSIRAEEVETLDDIDRLNARLAAITTPLEDEVRGLAASLHAYVLKRRKSLSNLSKTEHVGNAGTVEWALSPPAVRIEDVDAVMAELQRRQSKKFIRQPPPEINREAMLEYRDTAEKIPGVTITQAEKVRVRPTGAHGYVESTIGKTGKPGKWTLVWPKETKPEK